MDSKTANKNSNLHAAKSAKNDEFYTQLADIERECTKYRDQFRGKTIFLNCDDPITSNFWVYFSLNFEFFGLGRLISTHYDPDGASYSLELIKGKGPVRKPLLGNGDFRSAECIELLKQSDVVVTNPPFSLFREYLDTLDKWGGKYLVIGNKNALTYKEVFKLIKDERLWLGYTSPNEFRIPVEGGGTAITKTMNGLCRWFTNMDTTKRHEPLILYKKYTPESYPQYDNYDAINVDKVSDIPIDYFGIMGVPITYLDNHCPTQFELLGLSGTNYQTTKNYGKKERVEDGVRKKSNTGALGCVVRTATFGAGTHFDVGYPVKGIYRRLFIQRRKEKNQDED